MSPRVNQVRDRRQAFVLGQQFQSRELDTHGQPLALTVTQIAKDRFGMTHITLTQPNGRDISAFADQVAAAIDECQLTRVDHLLVVAV